MKSRDQILLEEAYQLILEEQSIEFYHAADKKDLESFKGGIRIDLAGTKHNGAGKGQGAGFYVFKKKEGALHHAVKINEGDQVIVVIARNGLNPSEFDVDYEASAGLVKKLILKHWDFFVSHYKEFNMYYHMQSSGGEPEDPPKLKGVFKFVKGDDSSPTINCKNADAHMDTNIEDATLFWWPLIQTLQKINPALFSEFENEYLSQAKLLKYNGKETIYPVRIEDLQGNILWSK